MMLASIVLLAAIGATFSPDNVFAVRTHASKCGIEATSGPAVPERADALFDWHADTLYSSGGANVVYDSRARRFRFEGDGPVSQTGHYLSGQYGIRYRPRNRHVPFTTPPVGWMTWYAVKFKASDGVVMDNARRFMEAFGDYVDERPVLWVDWEWYHEKMCSAGAEDHDLITPRKAAYPRGMRAVSDDLRKLGFVPALWVSAICDVRTNALWKAHPEWILGERRNWSGGVWADPTAPGFCEEFIPGLFRRYRDEWGYEAFKWDTVPNSLDLLGELQDRMYDPTVTPEDAFRRMVLAAREELGPNVYLESCAAIKDRDLLSMIDLFDSGRIGDDIFGWTEFCRNGVDRLLRFFPLHSTAFWADADNLVLRKEFSTEAQARTRVSVYGLLGVPVTVGDAMSELDSLRIDMLRRIMPVVPVTPASLDRGALNGDNLDLTVDFARDFGSWQVKAWVNLSTNCERIVLFDAPGCVAWDYWNDRLLPTGELRLAPCDTLEARVTPLAAEGPTLLSVSRHLTQGGYELRDYSADAHGARGTVRCPGGEAVKVSFLLPDGMKVVSASHLHRVDGRIMRLEISSSQKGDVAFEIRVGH